jgi:hypothetical protein
MSKAERDCSALRKKKLDVRCIRAQLGSTERLVLDALRSWENFETGEACPSQEMLALQTDLSREKVNRALKCLCAAGLLTTRPRPKTRALAYVIVDTEQDPEPNAALGAMLRDRLAAQPSRRMMVTHDHHPDDGNPRSQRGGTMVIQDHNDGDPRSPYDGDPRSPEVPILQVPIEEPPPTPVPSPLTADSTTQADPPDAVGPRRAIKTAPRALAAKDGAEGGFGALEACRAVHEASRGMFPKVEKVNLSRAHARSLGRLVQDFPDRTEWRGLGEYIATGAYDRWGGLGIPWLISYARSAMVQAKDWKQRQHPPKRPPELARVTRAPEPTPGERQAVLQILRNGMEGLRQRALRAEERQTT